MLAHATALDAGIAPVELCDTVKVKDVHIYDPAYPYTYFTRIICYDDAITQFWYA